jgi:CBS domain-containing protein
MATVQEILGRKGGEVVSLHADESVLTAASAMNERGIGSVLVMHENELVGIFTERDVLRRVVAEQRDPAAVKLREVMTVPVITCKPEARVEECMALFTEKRVRHIPVMDDGGLHGVITSGDLVAHQVQEQKDTIQYLNSYVFDIRS